MAGEPKQFRLLAGIPLAEWSLRAMAQIPWIDGTVIVLPPKRPVPGAFEESGATIVEGGADRVASAAAGLAALDDSVRTVLIHDAARPFVGPELIERVGACLATGAQAVVPGIPVSDTVKRVSAGGEVVETLPRQDLVAVQTPQGFTIAALREAHSGSPSAPATDDAALAEAAGIGVSVVEGDPLNFKVTSEHDWAVASALAESGVVKPAEGPWGRG